MAPLYLGQCTESLRQVGVAIGMMREFNCGHRNNTFLERHRHRLGQESVLEEPPLALPPPDSRTSIKYLYANDTTETKPGFQTPLGEVYFRLCHLGYSLEETKAKFNTAVTRWNRTANLRLTFEEFHNVLSSVDFASLTAADLEPYIWDFRVFLMHLLGEWDTDGALLEDFIYGLDFAITLRTIADRVESHSLLLQWHDQDLIDSGWVTLEDLTDIDRPSTLLQHTTLFGRLQDHAGIAEINKFDSWLASRGLLRTAPYIMLKPDGTKTQQILTLPASVRHMIHHPENPNNSLSDDDLRESLELLLVVTKNLTIPLPI